MGIGEKVLVPYQKMRHLLGMGRDSDWANPLAVLRGKWGQVPLSQNGRVKTSELLALPDDKLIMAWHDADKSQEIVRQWYRVYYRKQLKGMRVLDVGCGLAFDTIWFALHGAKLTFCDIVPENVEIVKRVCELKGIAAVCVSIDDIKELPLLGEYDYIMALGSLHHAPQEVIALEIKELTKHLVCGGHWLQLAYPKSRWERQGRLPFSIWGKVTDGNNTPWAEWYDADKLGVLLGDAFNLVMYQEFHNRDFNWFDYEKITGRAG